MGILLVGARAAQAATLGVIPGNCRRNESVSCERYRYKEAYAALLSEA